jgi:regulator of replication initiation timing
MKKITVISICLAILSVAACVYMYNLLSNKKSQIQVLENNQESLAKNVETYRNDKNQLVQKNTQLQLTVDEMKELNLLSKQEMKDMKVKYKNLQTYVKVLLESKQDTTVAVRDTTFVQDSTLIVGKHFNFDNYWYRCDGTIYNDKVDLKLGCNHEVTAASEIIYKGWWIFKKPKKIETAVMVANPNDTIKKSLVIDVIKKKKNRKVK